MKLGFRRISRHRYRRLFVVYWRRSYRVKVRTDVARKKMSLQFCRAPSREYFIRRDIINVQCAASSGAAITNCSWLERTRGTGGVNENGIGYVRTDQLDDGRSVRRKIADGRAIAAPVYCSSNLPQSLPKGRRVWTFYMSSANVVMWVLRPRLICESSC